MKNSELLEVLLSTNRMLETPVDTSILESILSCVMMNPLPEDRGACQEQIRFVINQQVEIEYDNNKHTDS